MLSLTPNEHINPDHHKNREKLNELKKEVEFFMSIYGFNYYSIYKETPYPLTRKKTYLIHSFDEDFDIDRKIHSELLSNIERISEYEGEQSITYKYKIKEITPKNFNFFNRRNCTIGYSTIFRSSKMGKVVCSFFTLGVMDIITGEKNDDNEMNIHSLSIAKRYSYLTDMYDVIPPLSKREIEILRWSSEGKTSSEIATILDLSISTINFHIRNSLIKLSVSNKVAAIAKSICYNII